MYSTLVVPLTPVGKSALAISMPTLMSLADSAAYALVLAHIGEKPMAVTSSLIVHFLRQAQAGVIAQVSALGGVPVGQVTKALSKAKQSCIDGANKISVSSLKEQALKACDKIP